MRVLCVDAGNTTIKFAVCSRLGVQRVAKKSTAAFVVDSTLPKPISAPGAPGVDGVVVCSVVPEGEAALRRTLREAMGIAPLFVDHTLRFPFRLQVAAPQELGSDRLCAAAGAIQRRGASAIIIDVGSAITVDVVRQGGYRGGLIMAGPAMGLDALGRFARKLPSIDYSRVEEFFPANFTDTRGAMIRGASCGAVGAIREAVRTLEADVGRRLTTVITGGAARALCDRLPKRWVYRPDLVFAGLHRVWRLNAGS